MKKLIILCLAGMSSACASYSYVTPEKDMWVEKNEVGYHGLYYCRGNPESGGTSRPICTEADERRFPSTPAESKQESSKKQNPQAHKLEGWFPDT